MKDEELKNQLKKEIIDLCETNSSVMTYMECLMKKYDKLKLEKEDLELRLSVIKDYKSRNEKAIEYIKNDWYELNTRDIEHCINLNKDIRIDLLNILNGSDEE